MLNLPNAMKKMLNSREGDTEEINSRFNKMKTGKVHSILFNHERRNHEPAQSSLDDICSVETGILQTSYLYPY
ncbi:MAG: hypothetical protein CK425_05080 [Parachlamydia sp.]|nr:MAG: hypothetical protein CK425_05080 [Parachlamydia sp.]